MFGIYDLNLCSDLPFGERLKIYKQIGFDEIALYLDSKHNRSDENYVDIINYARKIGLTVNQVHLDYHLSNAICDPTTNEYFDYISQKLAEANNLNIKYVVAHASKGDNPPLLNSTQLDKFEKMMNKFDNQPAILCLENVRNCTNLFSILRLGLKNVAVCFDVGHAHCYADEKQLFEQCKPYAICSHIHNNFGQDTHQSPKDGEIDLAYFAKQLTEIKNCSNCLECFPPRGSNFSKEEFASFVKLLYDETNEILSN